MEIGPIRSKVDHNAAHKEIDRLRGAALGTQGGDRLEVPVTRVEAYETER